MREAGMKGRKRKRNGKMVDGGKAGRGGGGGETGRRGEGVEGERERQNDGGVGRQEGEERMQAKALPLPPLPRSMVVASGPWCL